MIIDEDGIQLLLEEVGITLNHPFIGWRNVVALTNVTSDTADASFPVTNIANPATNLYWQAGDVSDQDVYINDIGGSDVDFVGIVNHNFGTGEIGVQILGDGYEALSPLTTPDTNKPLIFRFTPRDVDQLTIRLSPLYEEPFMAVVYVGKLTYLQRRFYVGHTPLSYGRITKMTNGYSEGGHFLGNIIVSETKSTAISLLNLKPDWYRTNLDPFIASKTPFFFGWRPTSYPGECGYAWLVGSPKPINQRSNGMMSIEMQINGITE